MKLLQYAIGGIIVIEGIDKYLNLLADWKDYAAWQLVSIAPITMGQFLAVLGVVEIIVGLVFLLRPSIGGWLVAGLMLGIIINLLILGKYYNLITLNVIVGLAALSVSQAKQRHDLIPPKLTTDR